MNTAIFPTSGDTPGHSAVRRHLARSVVAGLAAASLIAGAAPVAHGDALTDEQARIRKELAQSQQNVDEFSAELNQAAAALSQSQAELASAQAELVQARAVRAAAQAEDARLAGEVEKAKKALKAAEAKVAANQKALDKEVTLIGASVRETHQQNTELLGLAAFTQGAGGTGDVNEQVQWSTTIFNATQARMDRLTELQLKLEDAKLAADKAKRNVEAQKQAAAEQVAVTQQAEAAANDAEASVATMVAANQQAAQAAESQLATEKKRQAGLEADNAAVGRRIAARIAAQKAAEERARKAAAERARKAEAERRARAQAAARAKAEAARLAREAARAKAARAADAAAKAKAAKRAAAKAKAAADSASSSSSSSSSSTTTTRTTYSSGSSFSYPVAGPITSVYGMRFHPVLHVWKLHDGTDFGAGCGAPIRAPRDGVVAEAYYNAGYGNRLMLDHGNVGGNYITTGYNHAQYYTVSVGQHVSAGQIIGYVGTTGYSTGCHLHLMVWKNGTVVNPMSVF